MRHTEKYSKKYRSDKQIVGACYHSFMYATENTQAKAVTSSNEICPGRH